MSPPLLLQQCAACLVRLIWMFFGMVGRWLYSCCFVESHCSSIYSLLRENRLIDVFPNGINTKRKANSLIQDLNLGRRCYFLRQYSLRNVIYIYIYINVIFITQLFVVLDVYPIIFFKNCETVCVYIYIYIYVIFITQLFVVLDMYPIIFFKIVKQYI